MATCRRYSQDGWIDRPAALDHEFLDAQVDCMFRSIPAVRPHVHEAVIAQDFDVACTGHYAISVYSPLLPDPAVSVTVPYETRFDTLTRALAPTVKVAPTSLVKLSKFVVELVPSLLTPLATSRARNS